MADSMKDNDTALPKHLWEKENKELRNAIYWKRKAVDSAKKRAAAQNVDYPTFANLVSVAHLKPVERKKPGQEDEEEPAHIYKGTGAPAWSFDPADATKPSDLENEDEDAEDGLPSLERRVPGNEAGKITDDEFARNWRHLNKDVLLQMAFLTDLDPDEYPKIFKVELPPNLLADFLATICTCFRAEENARKDPVQQKLLRAACARDVNEDWTVRMLEAMTKCGRFSLAIGFIGEKTRAMARALIAHLNNSDWCKQSDEPKDPAGKPQPQLSRISRIQNIAALYKLQVDRKKE